MAFTGKFIYIYILYTYIYIDILIEAKNHSASHLIYMRSEECRRVEKAFKELIYLFKKLESGYKSF